MPPDNAPPTIVPASTAPTSYKPWRPFGGKDHVVRFYIPSKDKDTNELDDKVLENITRVVMTFMLESFQGATLTLGEGYFKQRENPTVQVEKVRICSSYCTEWQLRQNDTKIGRIANGVTIECNQWSTGVEIDGTFYLYEPVEAYREVFRENKISGSTDYHRYLGMDIQWPEVSWIDKPTI